MTVAERVAEDGFAIVRDALSADEVAQLRGEAMDAITAQGLPLGNGRVIPNAAVRAPAIRWLVSHPNIVGAVAAALGSPVEFTFEADIHKNYVAGNWHKDTGEQVMAQGYFDCDPIGRDDCRVLKVGIYLQDHTAGGGLTVRPGSHRTGRLDVGEAAAVPTRPGDVVLFDVRLTHRGKTSTIFDKAAFLSTKTLPKARRAVAVDSRRERVMALLHRPPRLAIYLAYGIPNERTTTFASRNHRRQQAQTNSDDPATERAAAAELLANGVVSVTLSRD